jgi:hypothetical protein
MPGLPWHCRQPWCKETIFVRQSVGQTSTGRRRSRSYEAPHLIPVTEDVLCQTVEGVAFIEVAAIRLLSPESGVMFVSF